MSADNLNPLFKKKFSSKDPFCNNDIKEPLLNDSSIFWLLLLIFNDKYSITYWLSVSYVIYSLIMCYY